MKQEKRMYNQPFDLQLKYFRGRLIEEYLKTAFQAVNWMPCQIMARMHCDIKEDVPYHPDGEPHHLLDIYRPEKASARLPVLMYIHGGGFSICSKDTHRPVGLAYADRGYLVFNVNYRLSPKHRFPAALEDVSSAYQWIVENAEQYGGDPDRIVIAGESAGANLALALTIACCYRRPEIMAQRVWDTGITPKAALILCGILQVSNPDRFKNIMPVCRDMFPVCHYFKNTWNAIQLSIIHDIAASYIGIPYDNPPDGCELADPLKVMESDILPDRPLPAVFAMVGADDALLDDTNRLEAALKRQNAVHEVKYYPDEEHVFHLMCWKKEAERFWEDNWAFLKKYVGM